VTADGWSIDLMAEFGILQAEEVAELLKLRHSTVLDLSRAGSCQRSRSASTGAIGALISLTGSRIAVRPRSAGSATQPRTCLGASEFFTRASIK
jgi:hypothetical protein